MVLGKIYWAKPVAAPKIRKQQPIVSYSSLYSKILFVPATLIHAPHYEWEFLSHKNIPGYFADPTVKKFGDTYYMYATTDGSGAVFGPAQVWTSKDFVNWTLMPMNWPDSHWIWAPDVMAFVTKRSGTRTASLSPNIFFQGPRGVSLTPQ